ncbi:MAG: PTS sugar transporter subunit IIA [Gemmatimonadetes bacterium]|nr:PTS sugar transporter subunit IIA [Gemmatimonadota bacterium]
MAILSSLFTPSEVKLDLAASSKEEVLAELVGLLGCSSYCQATLLRTLRRRENLGSTGIGGGVAIPHCRTEAVGDLRVAYGRKAGGLEFNAIDGAPVRHFFLIAAPPVKASDNYLNVLAQIAHFVKRPETSSRLGELADAHEFLELIEAS